MDATPDIITSATNPLIKRLRSLDRKKARAEHGTFLAEGARLIEQALQRGWRVETLLTGRADTLSPHLVGLSERARQQGARHITVPDRLLGSISRKHNPQAVLAEIHQRNLSLDAVAADPQDLWVGLYEVRDPGNLGTILRTVDCAGAGGVILIGDCCDPFSVEAVRASMGSLFDVRVAKSDYAGFARWRQKAGFKLVAASMHGTAAHTEIAFQSPSLILMGNEQAGLPAAIEAACDTLCRIPMRGGADSLNLAQASAIMLYEAWRQRGFQ